MCQPLFFIENKHIQNQLKYLKSMQSLQWCTHRNHRVFYTFSLLASCRIIPVTDPCMVFQTFI
jgi:hypothetical protein